MHASIAKWKLHTPREFEAAVDRFTDVYVVFISSRQEGEAFAKTMNLKVKVDDIRDEYAAASANLIVVARLCMGTDLITQDISQVLGTEKKMMKQRAEMAKRWK
jgi:hypothetical protein